MKTAFLSFLSVCLLKVSALATPVDLGTNSRGTPYDPYMSPVRNVLGHLDGDRPSIEQVRQLIREGRGFRYSFTNPYVASLPSTTAARHAGDCKDKALWLANQLNDPSVRFVIGKARSTSRISHAWLYWKDADSRWWILDCTNNSAPVSADRVSSNEYIPLYSFTKNGSYRHGATQFYASSSVAGRRTVAANTR